MIDPKSMTYDEICNEMKSIREKHPLGDNIEARERYWYLRQQMRKLKLKRRIKC